MVKKTRRIYLFPMHPHSICACRRWNGLRKFVLVVRRYTLNSSTLPNVFFFFFPTANLVGFVCFLIRFRSGLLVCACATCVFRYPRYPYQYRLVIHFKSTTNLFSFYLELSSCKAWKNDFTSSLLRPTIRESLLRDGGGKASEAYF